jgi:2-succinyl-6-hydroxy-2,4-cyclohexadiene-1-carboxylate synthase
MLNYVLSGDLSSPVLVFLHGFLGTSGDWKATSAALAGEFCCVGVDLPGHGLSLNRADSDYTIPGAAACVVEVLDTLGIERCVPVGYSMGGRVALYLAVQYAERCRRLVLESATPGIESEAERAARRDLDERWAIELETLPFEEFLRKWYEQPVFKSLAQRAGLAERIAASRRAGDPRELACALRGMSQGRQPSLWDHLPVLSPTTLAIAGALDGRYAEIAERMAVQNDRLRAAIIPRAGHNVHAENPEAFVGVLRDFLKYLA